MVSDLSSFEKKLILAREIPRANELRLDIHDFNEFTKNKSAIYPPFNDPDKFNEFMDSLCKTVIEDSWNPKIIFVSDEKDLKAKYKPPQKPIETSLEIYFENQRESEFTERGNYKSRPMIRKGVVKPFGNNWATNFSQNDLARAIEIFFAGTNYFPISADDFPHSFNLPLSKGSRLDDGSTHLKVYPDGVRYLSIDLIPIDDAIEKIKEEMKKCRLEDMPDISEYARIEDYHNSLRLREYTKSEGTARLELLNGWRNDDPFPFLTDENVKPLPEKFARQLERVYNLVWGNTEKAMKTVIKNVDNGIERDREARKFEDKRNQN